MLSSGEKRFLGLCIGSSTVSSVLIRETDSETGVVGTQRLPHYGRPRETLQVILDSITVDDLDSFAIVRRGNAPNNGVPVLTEAEAVEYAYSYFVGRDAGYDAIVSAGATNFMVYLLDHHGHIARVYSGNKCASGTGEFFLQQIGRMGLTLDEATEQAISETNPYRVSGRCSVFCKSDCTHALNKGVEKSRVVSGLCGMMAERISALVHTSGAKRILVIGGVAQNRAVIQTLRAQFSELVVPEYAECFEALGAALWASGQPLCPLMPIEDLFPRLCTSFTFLPALVSHEPLVHFIPAAQESPRPNDECILGLDVGSTTTKAVLLRTADCAVTASVYLRTNGDPIGASRKCYASLAEQVGTTPVDIIGLGTTGSGRHIAGIHALTENVINEITAHAAAARYVDKDVDTVFEIGGQDAKYTHLVNGVATDYAMNEACSAGTGSFLEEAAGEHLEVAMTDIAPLALRAERPLNFSDECAAFIASDINSAVHEGFDREDIVAGIVYSICMNYLNRVKQNRPVGNKILMQGGVCYNKAVPIAMAGLTDREIIVPPEPGLMGAFGVALEVKQRLDLELAERGSYSLADLANREVTYKEPFICSGGKEGCDRRCEVSRIEVAGKTFPFGGSCRKYENIRLNRSANPAEHDHVVARAQKVFEKKKAMDTAERHDTSPLRIGVMNSFLTHVYYPLFSEFFSCLGAEIVLPETIEEQGICKQGAAFCYPMQDAHDVFAALLQLDVDYYFLPLLKELPDRGNDTRSHTCVFVRSEPYVLKAAFDGLVEDRHILSPTLDFSGGLRTMESEFVKIGRLLGFPNRPIRAAFDKAVRKQESLNDELRRTGGQPISTVEGDSSAIAVVLFGRPYSALNGRLNMGIPHKLATQGIHVVPFDCLPLEEGPKEKGIYWAIGSDLLQAAHFVKHHPQLYAIFITNFSCGPDSFLLGYFREIMGDKPSLVLELDSHTSDVGVDTRIEAFLDIVRGHREVQKSVQVSMTEDDFLPASAQKESGVLMIRDSEGRSIPLSDPRIHVLIPEMGRLNSRGLAAALRRENIRATVWPTEDNALKRGREAGTCRECIPFQLTTGSLLDYLDHRESDDEIVLFFMPKSHGPCRQGQYTVAVEKLIKKHRLRNALVFSLDDECGFGELGTQFTKAVWHILIISDIFENIRNVLIALAENRKKALEIFDQQYERILDCLERDSLDSLANRVREAVLFLDSIPLTMPVEDAPKVRLLGEVYARGNDFCRQGLVEKLADRGFVVYVAPLAEYIYYADFTRQKRYSVRDSQKINRIEPWLRSFTKHRMERKIRDAFSGSALVEQAHPTVPEIVRDASHFISPHILSESVLSIGLALHEILEETCGTINLGPFGCMPTRVTQAILESHMNVRSKKRISNNNHSAVSTDGLTHLPFLSIEVDGRSMSDIDQARLNTFCLQARRVHEHMKTARCSQHRTSFLRSLLNTFESWASTR